MLLTGALRVVAPGSSVQVVIALVVIMVNMLIVLKLGPFADDADDFLSFATSLQMVLTLLVAILLMTDRDSVYHDKTYMDVVLIFVNCLSLLALLFSIASMHPKIRARLNSLSNGGSTNDAKVVPVVSKGKKEKKSKNELTAEEEEEEAEASDLRRWGKG